MTIRQYCPARVLRHQADVLRQAFADGTAITDAVARIRDGEAAALDQRRGPRPR
ncbi:hypothetical protein KXR53_32565 [Inquilinus limosus]|uniref:hypothetical protein n=1 Tax=Inquilinus limosus TaxID=171674 RepID=UPI003F15F0EA